MQALFPLITFVALGLFVLIGILSMLTHRNLHDQIGQGGFYVSESHSRLPQASLPPPDPPPELDHAERELEIRQMLTARSERLVRRGHAPLDIEAELARIDGAGETSAHDAALADEVRQLAIARNERRLRQGLEPLDVEAEVARTLTELDP
jgi:hypothetical protein